MKKSRLLAAALLSLSLIASGTSIPVKADSSSVVTLGANLTQDQKQTMLKYFNVNPSEVQILTITNQDEINHLAHYVPMAQIGTRTLSCAYVKPTTSGGIKVRTANLTWVTGNMIASTLSTSGVKNCEVIAACPFAVSGTGALTGIQMAYETASGQTLDAAKKDVATHEIVVTGNLGDQVGVTAATNVVNKTKMEVIENNVTNNQEITNIVNNVVQENNINITNEQVQQIVNLMVEISEQNYNYEDVKETLEHIDENTAEGGAIAEKKEEEGTESSGDSESTDSTEPESAGEAEEESIINNVNEDVLGSDIVQSSTEDQSLENDTYQQEPEGNTTGSDDGWETFPTEGENIPSEEFPPATDNTETPAEQTGESEPVDAELPESTEGQEEPADDTEILISGLSEQARSQYDKAVNFCKGEYEGDYNALAQAMGADFVPTASAPGDPELAGKLTKAVTYKYLKILTEGRTYADLTGNEKYQDPTLVQLNDMNTWLEKLFAVNGKAPEGEDILASLSMENRQHLYDDTIRFFEKMYGYTAPAEEPAQTEELPPEETNTENTEGNTEEPSEDPYTTEYDESGESWDVEEYSEG